MLSNVYAWQFLAKTRPAAERNEVHRTAAVQGSAGTAFAKPLLRPTVQVCAGLRVNAEIFKMQRRAQMVRIDGRWTAGNRKDVLTNAGLIDSETRQVKTGLTAGE